MSSTEKEGALYHACQSRRYSSFSSSVHPTLEGNHRIATARATIAWLLAFPPRKLTRFYMEGLKWKAHFGLYMSLSHNKTDMPLPYICTIPSKQHRWYLTKQIASDKKNHLIHLSRMAIPSEPLVSGLWTFCVEKIITTRSIHSKSREDQDQPTFYLDPRWTSAC